MKHNLYFFNYNNYANRILKREEAISYYPSPVLTILNVEGFPFGDGISTVCTYNVTPWNHEVTPDYLVVCNNENGVLSINSRWFVIDSEYTRQGQFKATLYRDTLAECKSAVLGSPCYIEKGWMNPKTAQNTLIFSPENVTLSQIKTKVKYLYDETKTPWVVGYFDKKIYERGQTEGQTADQIFTISTDETVDATYATWSDLPISRYIQYSESPEIVNVSNVRLSNLTTHFIESRLGQNLNYADSVGYPGMYQSVIQKGTHSQSLIYFAGVSAAGRSEFWNRFASRTTLKKAFCADLNDHVRYEYIVDDEHIYSDVMARYLKQQAGKKLKVGNKYFQLRLVEQTLPYGIALDRILDAQIVGTIDDILESVWSTSPERSNINLTLTGSTTPYEVNGEFTLIYLVAEQYEATQKTVKIPVASNEIHAPYKMFALPWNALNIDESNAEELTMSGELGRQIQAGLSEQLGGTSNTFLYDMQLLPYCPVRHLINDGGNIDLSLGTPDIDFSEISHTEEGQKKVDGYIFFPASENGSFTIEYGESDAVISDYKMQSIADMHRINSPNYGASFDFNAAKNEGIPYLNVRYTYKPFNPLVMVFPRWGGVYGNIPDPEKESRGLVCRGDFSLPVVSNAWINYQTQNKYYQDVFNREIENIELNQNAQRLGQVVGAITGTASAISTGALGGGNIAGGAGAIAGGAVSGLLSAAGGVADIAIGDKLRKEQLDYKADMYGFNLATIQARPNTLSNIGVQDINNTLVPTLEYYTCSSAERQALRDKLRFNGMSISAIGILSDYIDPDREEPQYIKGRLIRLEGVNEDYHFAQTIIEELQKGVFV